MSNAEQTLGILEAALSADAGKDADALFRMIMGFEPRSYREYTVVESQTKICRDEILSSYLQNICLGLASAENAEAIRAAHLGERLMSKYRRLVLDEKRIGADEGFG